MDRRGHDDCWLWKLGAPGGVKGGYGVLRGPCRRTWRAHRLSWALVNGRPVPKGLGVHHTCEDRYAPGDITYRRCVNPAHLKVGTQLENMADMLRTRRDAPSRPRGVKNGTHTRPETRRRGEQHGMAKLTAEKAIAIRERYRVGGISMFNLGAQYGVSERAVHDIIHGRTWSHAQRASGTVEQAAR